jgi:hypothetical protein
MKMKINFCSRFIPSIIHQISRKDRFRQIKEINELHNFIIEKNQRNLLLSVRIKKDCLN